MFIDAGSVWKYLDNGTNQDTDWRRPSFDDSTWASGPAKLGYGDPDIITTVGYGPSPGNKYVTTYFRRIFNVTDAARFTSLFLRIWRDDGAVVYLNGEEVLRDNMPATPIAFNTLALSAPTIKLVTTTIGPEHLVNGANVLAVEIHQNDHGSSDIAFDFEISGSGTTIPARVTRGPYLQQGAPTSVGVRWRTDVATDSRVLYGTSPGNLNFAVSDGNMTTEHEVKLTGLLPETIYYYSVGTTTIPLIGDNDSHFFRTPPSDGVARPTRIWALGDSGATGSNALLVRNAYIKFAGASYTNVWLMLGDNAYNTGTDDEYQLAVFDFYPQILKKSVLWPTLGNHDTAGAANPPPSLPYYNIFSLPTNGEAGGLLSGTEKYYSFNHGNIHFICLDSMASSRAATGPMAIWLQNDLAANTQPWIIAYWHHPPYSKGTYNSDTVTQSVEMRQNIVPILEAGGVDLVLTAHSNSYERSFLIDGHYGTSSTFNDSMKKNGGDGKETGNGAYTKGAGHRPREGTVYVVAGSSGRTAGGTFNHPAIFKSSNTLGSLVLDINDNRLDARFLTNNGVVNDSFTIIKGATPTFPPAAPSGLTATPISASRIDLAWTDNSNNETEFRIEKSTDDGTTFTPAATTSANATTQSITGLLAQTTYHFRVIAFNSAGDSGYSATANATTLQAAPSVPTGLTATVISSSQINLAWVDNSNDETGFRIEQSTNGGATFPIAYETASNLTNFSVTGLSAFTTYQFRVRAYNSGGESDNSNVVSATTPQALPAAPSGLTATAISSSQINLAWTDNSNNETGFSIEQSTDGTNFVLLVTTSANATTRSITGLTSQTTYHYRVQAVNTAGVSDPATASATTPSVTATPPTAPSGLTANVLSASAIRLTWQDKSNNEQGFYIERCLGSLCSTSVQIDQAGPNATNYNDANLSANSTYRYRVRAFNAAGNSSYSNSVQAKTLPGGGVLVSQGSVWKYLDNGSNQETAWRESFFPDSAWASGPAKLGYGDGDEATVVSYGPSPGNKYITTYFRQTFNVLDSSGYEGLTLQLKRDDGAVVYLNGVEVWRVDMPLLPVNIPHTTRASAATDATGFLEKKLVLADWPGLLVNGANVIAIEIHQFEPGSSDIAFDFQLLGTGSAIGFNRQSPESYRVDDRTTLRAAAMTKALSDDSNRIHSWRLFPIKLRLDRLSITRNEFMEKLKEGGVGCSVHWRPLHLRPYYQETFGWRPEDLPTATAAWERSISLPIFPGMTDEDMEHVARAVRSECARHARPCAA